MYCACTSIYCYRSHYKSLVNYMFNMIIVYSLYFIFFFKQKTAYEMRISDWSSDVCSSDLCKLKSEKPAKCKANRALAMTINILSLDFHVGAMAQHALDHGGDLGGRAALELGIDACRASFDMPVDHDAPSTITRMPFRHQVAIPGSELCGI